MTRQEQLIKHQNWSLRIAIVLYFIYVIVHAIFGKIMSMDDPRVMIIAFALFSFGYFIALVTFNTVYFPDRKKEKK